MTLMSCSLIGTLRDNLKSLAVAVDFNFNDSQELVLVDFKKLYDCYLINEYIVRRGNPYREKIPPTTTQPNAGPFALVATPFSNPTQDYLKILS